MDLLRPIEERAVEDIQPSYTLPMKTVGGIQAIVDNGSVRLLSLGSASRGIPYKQWDIPLPVVNVDAYGFCPRADVFAVAVVEPQYLYVL